MPRGGGKKCLGAQASNTRKRNLTPNFPSYTSGHAVLEFTWAFTGDSIWNQVCAGASASPNSSWTVNRVLDESAYPRGLSPPPVLPIEALIVAEVPIIAIRVIEKWFT
jgi:hypothetical protein